MDILEIHTYPLNSRKWSSKTHWWYQ